MEDVLGSDQGGNGKGTDSSKKNKRARMQMTDSDSSDELLVTMRRKAREKTHKGGVGSRRSGEGDEEFGVKRELECEKKIGLDLFEFDEYDEFEGFSVSSKKSKMGREHAWSSHSFHGSRSGKKSMFQKRKRSCMDASNSEGGRKNMGVESGGGMSKLDLDEAEAQLPLSLLSLKSQKMPEEPIRLQGENGVLKVMVNNNNSNKKTNLSRKGNEKNRLSESITPVRSKSEKRIPSESSTPAEGSTEKQQVRDTIKEMLIKSSWTIDYRPRRNRDYLDAVYIHPGGTAYWSITKAYEALQKQFNDQEGRSKPAGLSSSFTPISEDLLSKLTRQSRKKVGKKIKKRREDGMQRTNKPTVKKESVEAMDSDQPEETLSSYIRKKRKASQDKMQDLYSKSGSESSDHSCKRTPEGDEVKKSPDATNNRMVQGRLGSLMQRCTLRIRDLNKAHNSGSDGYVAYSGKRTVLAWLIDSGVVQSGGKVQYMNHKRTRVRLEGWITKQGIHCGCCSKIVTVSKFELHAGSKSRRPFENIFLETGVSLLQCLIDAWKQQDKTYRQDFYYIDVNDDDPDDDTCGTCGDGGDLVCCDSCPSTFHQSCLEIEMVPNGDWHCPNCVCKFCGTARRNDAGGDLSGDKLNTCSLCERKYHKLCSTVNGATPVDSSSVTAHFCGQKCQELHDNVRKILGVKQELEAGFSWSLIRRTDINSDVADSKFAQRVECNSKLAVAHSVTDECFLPIIDRRSGINLVHNVLYSCGANFPRLNFGSFYCAILERGDELISAASIRIHGTHLAEMPFIGTRHIYRRQGMCSRLLSAIEVALSSFKVENLIIPAISEHMNTWTTTFGFNPIEEDLKKEIKYLNMLVFPGTDMLQKQLVKPMTDDAKAINSRARLPQLPAVTRKFSYIGDEGNDAKVHLHKNLNNFDVEFASSDSAAPANITDPSALLAPDSTSKSEIQYSVAETTLDQNNQVVESCSKLSSSLSAPRTSLFGLEKPVDPLNEDSIQSYMETAAGDQPAGTVESSGKELYDVPKDHEGSDPKISAEIDGNDFVHSDAASDANVIIQSTCEVKTKDHDVADPSIDNVLTDVNGRSSLSEDGSKNQCLIFSTDLNKPGVDAKEDDVILVTAPEVTTGADVASAKPLPDTSLVCEVVNYGDNNAGASVEHVNTCDETVASEEIDAPQVVTDADVASAKPLSDSSLVCEVVNHGNNNAGTAPVEHVNTCDETVASEEIDAPQVATDADVAGAKALTDTPLVCEMVNDGDNNPGSAPVEHTDTCDDTLASEEIDAPQVATDADIGSTKALKDTPLVFEMVNQGENNVGAAPVEHTDTCDDTVASKEIDAPQVATDADVARAKALTDTPLVCEMVNHDDNNAGSAPVEHTYACDDSVASEEIDAPQVATDADVARAKALMGTPLVCEMVNHDDSNAGSAPVEHTYACDDTVASEKIDVPQVGPDADVASANSLTDTPLLCEMVNHGDNNAGAAPVEHTDTCDDTVASEEIDAPQVATDADVASAKALTDTPLVCEMGNHGDNNAGTAPVEHTGTCDDTVASEEIDAPQVATDADVASAKALTDTPLVCVVGNHGENNSDTAPVEHTGTCDDTMASVEIDEQSNIASLAGGGPVNSESSIKQLDIKGELCAVDQ